MERGAESACRRAFRCGCVCRSVCALCICGPVNQRRARACGFKEFCWVCRTASQAHNNVERRCCIICGRYMYGIELGGWQTLCDALATAPARQRCGNCDVSLINYFEWYRAHNGCAQVGINYSKRSREHSTMTPGRSGQVECIMNIRIAGTHNTTCRYIYMNEQSDRVHKLLTRPAISTMWLWCKWCLCDVSKVSAYAKGASAHALCTQIGTTATNLTDQLHLTGRYCMSSICAELLVVLCQQHTLQHIWYIFGLSFVPIWAARRVLETVAYRSWCVDILSDLCVVVSLGLYVLRIWRHSTPLRCYSICIQMTYAIYPFITPSLFLWVTCINAYRIYPTIRAYTIATEIYDMWFCEKIFNQPDLELYVFCCVCLATTQTQTYTSHWSTQILQRRTLYTPSRLCTGCCCCCGSLWPCPKVHESRLRTETRSIIPVVQFAIGNCVTKSEFIDFASNAALTLQTTTENQVQHHPICQFSKSAEHTQTFALNRNRWNWCRNNAQRKWNWKPNSNIPWLSLAKSRNTK